MTADRMGIKRRKAIIYGLTAGVIVAATCSLPMAIALLSLYTITPGSTSDSVSLYIAGFAMVLANLSLTCAPLSLPVAAVTGFAAVRSARAEIASLNDAMAVNLVASLLTALTGAFGASLLLGAVVYFTNAPGGFLTGYVLICAPAFALVLFTLSFFGGMVYSVYRLKLKYVQQRPGQ